MNQAWINSILVIATTSLFALTIWFIKRFVSTQDESNKALTDAVSKLKIEAIQISAYGAGFSKEIESRILSLDQKTKECVVRLETLVVKCEGLRESLFKIETRIGVLSEKLTGLEERLKSADGSITTFGRAVSNLGGPIDQVKSEFGKTSKIVAILATKLGKVEHELSEIKVSLGVVIKK